MIWWQGGCSLPSFLLELSVDWRVFILLYLVFL